MHKATTFLLLFAAGCLAQENAWPGAEWRTITFAGKQIHVQVVNGEAVYQGDMVLGPIAELEREDPIGKSGERTSSVIAGERFRWPGGVVPYVILGEVTNQSRVTEAIEHWNQNTNIRLQPRSGESAYVTFRRINSGCSASVGRVGAQQFINLADDCPVSAVIHEIGHAVGLWHTQSREDRDSFVEVLLENITPENAFNFNQAISNGEDYAGYAYESTMHYSSGGFSRNGKRTIRTIPPGIPIGLRSGLSPSDIDAVRRMYGEIPRETTIASNPSGRTLIVDGERITTPRSFDWTPGSVHVIEAEDQEVSEDERLVFARWSDLGERRHSIVASPDRTIFVAQFQQMFRLAIAALPEEGGVVSSNPPSDGNWFPATTEVELTVTANEGWNFQDWSGLGFFNTHGRSRTPASFTVLQSGLRYTARFTQSPVTRIVTQPPGLRVTVDGNTTTAPAGFAWMPGSSHTVSVDTTSQNGVSTGERYQFASWSSGTERSLTFQAGEQSSDIVARFDGEYRLTRVASPTSGGSIAATPEQTFYAAGSTVELTANPNAGFAFGGWTSGAAGAAESQTVTVDRELTVAAAFRRPFTLETNGVLHAASFEGGAIAPGEIITIFGLNIGPEQLTTLRLDGQGRVATALAETRVLIGGQPAPLIYAARNQVSAVVPYGVAGQANVPVSVEYQGRETNRVFLAVTDAAPAVFSANSSGKGAGAILNQDYSVNSAANPAERGSTVILYATGAGQTDPPSADGEVTRGARNQALPIRVRIGDQDAPFHYAGAAPDFVAGVMQINVVVPSNLAPGVVPVEIRAGDKVSPRTITLAIR